MPIEFEDLTRTAEHIRGMILALDRYVDSTFSKRTAARIAHSRTAPKRMQEI